MLQGLSAESGGCRRYPLPETCGDWIFADALIAGQSVFFIGGLPVWFSELVRGQPMAKKGGVRFKKSQIFHWGADGDKNGASKVIVL